MFDSFEVDNKSINRPIEADGLKINLKFNKGTLSELQPILSVNSLTFSGVGVSAIQCAREKYGAYQQIPIGFNYGDSSIFDGYLTNIKWLLDTDQIEAKPVSFNSTDNLSELLSAISVSLIDNDIKYRNWEYVIEKVDVSGELIQIGMSTLFYSYMLYTQIKQVADFAARAVEAIGNAAGLAFGTTVALVLEGIAIAIFLASTIIQLIKYLKQIKELFLPTKRTTKITTLGDLMTAYLDKIGYKMDTEFMEMFNLGHLPSGDIFKNTGLPRTTDRVSTGLGALNFIIDKFNANITVINKTVFIYSKYSSFFQGKSNHVLPDFVRGNYTENLDEMKGTREINYEVDYNDDWTLENFKGTEFKVRANIGDTSKSTIKGLDQTNLGVSLCSRKDSLNSVERAFSDFAKFANNLLGLFGGSGQSLKVPNKIGVGKISNKNLGVAKIIWLSGSKIPADHRSKLSAKFDEENYHWTKSHVRNPRAKKRLYENVLVEYDENSLNCNLMNNIVTTSDGVVAELSEVDWDYNHDNAIIDVEVEDVERDTRLKETFYEPIN